MGVEDLEMAATLCLATLLDAQLWVRPGGHRGSFCSCGGSPRRLRAGNLSSWALGSPRPFPAGNLPSAVLTEHLVHRDVHHHGAEASQHHTRPESSLKHGSLNPCAESDPGGLRWGLRTCISNEFACDADAGGPGATP